MRAAVIDTETTGRGPLAQVVEIAAVMAPRAQRAEKWWKSELTRPGIPIEMEAMAVHHITERMVADAPTPTEVVDDPNGPGAVLEHADAVAGHNLEFDLRCLANSGITIVKPGICTWRCSRHVWPQAPSFRNQALRYWLGLDVERDLAEACGRLPPHRALPDAIVTAALLERLVAEAPGGVAALVNLTDADILMPTVDFGEHEGRAWEDVPASYLRWISRKGPKVEGGGRREGWDRDTLHTARYWLERKSVAR